MNENLNLCEILKGCEGIELYSSAFGTVYLISMDKYGLNVEAIIESETIAGKPVKGKLEYKYSRTGRIIDLNDADITLFPSKDQRDWSKFKRPIKPGTNVMCSFDTKEWFLSKYIEIKDSLDNANKTYRGIEDVSFITNGIVPYIIPFDKFNPNDIEKSLKYNIQK